MRIKNQEKIKRQTTLVTQVRHDFQIVINLAQVLEYDLQHFEHCQVCAIMIHMFRTGNANIVV